MTVYRVYVWDYDTKNGSIIYIDSVGDIDAVDEVIVELQRRDIVEYEATACCLYGKGQDFWAECIQGEKSFGYFENEV